MAKIADLGMARIVPRMRGAATMTKAPGASIYMPPEALEDKSRYDTSIDIFSMAVVALFSLSQMFPDPLLAAFMDDRERMVGRTELERRSEYMQEVLRQFPQGHPFVHLIQQCLKNNITKRPSIQRVQQWLEEGRARVKDREFDVDKLSLTQLLASGDQSILAQRKENHTLSQQNEAQKEEIGALKRENDVFKEENDVLKAQISSLRDMIHTPQDRSIPSAVSVFLCIACIHKHLCIKRTCWQVGAKRTTFTVISILMYQLHRFAPVSQMHKLFCYLYTFYSDKLNNVTIQ